MSVIYTEDDYILIQDADGSESRYVKFASRLREFLKAYPLDQGWKVRIKRELPESLSAPVLDLYKAAMASGNTPEAMGLPRLNPFATIFVAQLLDSADGVVAEASSRGNVVSYKDHEKLESAAVQRLIAMRGFPGSGDILAEDEAADLASQKLEAKESAPAQAAEQEKEKEQATAQTPEPDSPAGQGEQENDERAPPLQVPAWKPRTKGAPAVDPAQALQRRIEQVQRQYAARGLTVPDIETMEDAATALRALRVSKPNGDAAAANG